MPTIPSYKEIPLTQGQVAIVDADDYEWLNQWKWCSYWNSHTRSFYAIRSTYHPKRTIYMHRLLLGLENGDPTIGDHRDHDTLNNQRNNLRVATPSESQRNRRSMRKNSTGLKGVSRHGNGFRASIYKGGKNVTLGTRKTPQAAHELYCQAAKIEHGDFVCLENQELTPL